MSVHIAMNPDYQEILYNTFHVTHEGDGRRPVPYRIPYEDVKGIVRDHTVVEKEKVSSLYYRTIKDQESYDLLFSAMRKSRMSEGVGMYTIFWPCGQAFVTAIKENLIKDDFLKNKRVLGLCSGSGLAEIYIAKHSGAELVVASDHDIFARAACHLNAELNDVEVGNQLLISKESAPVLSLTYHQGTDERYRLYDTVIAGDFRYGVLGSQKQDTLACEVLRHLRSATHGSDIFISEVDYAHLYMTTHPILANNHKNFAVQDNVSETTAIKQYGLPFVERAIACGLEPRHEETMLPFMPVRIHHWPARTSYRKFSRRQESAIEPSPPLLANRWWDRLHCLGRPTPHTS